MKSFRLLISILILLTNYIFAQEEDFFEDSTESLEIYLIDNYVKGEKEKILVLSWMTNIPTKSKVEINGIGEFLVSDTLTDFHQTKIDLTKFDFNKEENYFKIISELEDGKIVTSDDYSFLVPIETTSQSDTKVSQTSRSYYIYNFFMGFALWLLPSAGISIEDDDVKFAIVKDLPIVSIGSASAYKTFPYVYFYAGYSHIFNGKVKNSFRLGSKYLYEIKNVKHFISSGLGVFTNFKGSNGIYGDVGFSFLKILRTFEMYVSYSYNYLPSSKDKYHLINIGLFTSSFSINLNY